MLGDKVLKGWWWWMRGGSGGWMRGVDGWGGRCWGGDRCWGGG